MRRLSSSRWLGIPTLAVACIAIAAAVNHVRAGDDPRAAWTYANLKRSPDRVNPLPPDVYARAAADTASMSVYSTQLETVLPGGTSTSLSTTDTPTGTWAFLGPTNIGGRTRSMAFDPAFGSNGGIVYAAGVD